MHFEDNGFMNIISFLMLLVFMYPANNESDTTSDPYQTGLELSEKNKQEALEYWVSHQKEIENPLQIDPRIGFSFIEIATANQLNSYYKQASMMYIWALTTHSRSKAHTDALMMELERLKPLFDYKKYRDLKKLAKENLTVFTDELINYWYLKDPTPDSKYNERLIEHWERIAYAKNHFTKNSLTVYGTDERANIYMKYGEPEKVESGVLTFNTAKVSGWLSELETYRMGMSNNSAIGSSRSSGNNSNSSIRQTNSGIQSMKGINLYTRNIASKFPNPAYDIWFYDEKQLTQDYPSSDHWMFIFGDEGDTRQYGLRESIDEFIPKTAYRFTARDQRKIVPPSIMLQMLMYDEFSIVDRYFSESFNNLQSRVFNNNSLRSIRTHTSRIVKQENENRLRVRNITTNTLRETSTYEQNLDHIDSKITQFLFYDPYLGTPYYKTICSFDIQNTLKLNYLQSGSTNYQFYLNILLQDQNQRKKVHDTTLKFEFAEDYLNQDVSYTNIYRVPAMSQFDQQLYHLKIVDQTADERISSDSPFNKNIIALDNHDVENPEIPKKGRFESFSVSDVILGYKSKEFIKKELGNLSFNFSHDYTFKNISSLFIAFEAYNIPKQEQFHKFNLTYEIGAKQGILKRILKDRDEPVKRTATFTSGSSLFEHILEIKTDYLESGSYFIDLEFSLYDDPEKTVSQTIEFTIE